MQRNEMTMGYGQPKPMGMFGAPSCHCTPTLVALVAFCMGLIVAASGFCALVFFPVENLVQLPSVVMIVFGILLMLCSAGYFSYIYFCSTNTPRRLPNSGDEYYRMAAVQQQQQQQQHSVNNGMTEAAPPPYYDPSAGANQPQGYYGQAASSGAVQPYSEGSATTQMYPNVNQTSV